MYQDYYGLNELPFELTANPRFLFLTAKHREALSSLQYGLFAAKSLTLLLGEAGTGKTTLIQAALDSDRCRNVRCVYVNNPVLDPHEFTRMLALRFDLGDAAAASKSLLLERLETVLRERRSRGEITALVVDEAQSLSLELLEEIRLLANIETPSEKLLPLVLAGQPELGNRLENHELRQLKQRVTLRCELSPFELAETATYISTRITTAGAVPSRLFSQEAVMLIHEQSRGIPRTISVICDNALLSAMALGRSRVDRAIVGEVCRDLRLRGEPRHGLNRPPTGAADDPVAAAISPAALQEPGRNAASEEVPVGEPRRPRRFPFRFGAAPTPLKASARTITE